MSDISHLPLTVELAAGENAMSLASRLARRNGVPRMLTFCSDLALNHKALTNGDHSEVVRLSNLANCDTDAVLFWTPKFGEDGYFGLGSEKLKFTCFDRTHVQACPRCISENFEAQGEMGPAHLGIWQLTSIRTCHRHQCMLIGLPGPANRSDIFDYSRILDHEGSPATVAIYEEDQRMESWLLSRLENGARSGWLDSLPIHVALQTCENFGLLVAFGPKVARSKISPEQWLKAGAAGFNILKNRPDALTEKLKSIQRLTPVDSKQYRERYGIFFNWLRDRV